MVVKKVIVTGFGSFSGVENNPTTLLISELELINAYKDEKYSFQVLEVSVESCDHYLQQLLTKLDEELKTLSLEEIIDVCCIHLGVDSNATKIKLEQCAYNNMNFRVPDQREFQPSMTPILSPLPVDHCFRTYELEPVLSELRERNPVAGDTVTLSTDPGRYLCNYIYFRTMTLNQQPFQSAFGVSYPLLASDRVSFRSVFVHVPPFSVIDKATQLSIVQSIIQILQI